MNVSASPETIRAVAEAMQLAAVLDDRAPRPTEPRVAAWAEQAERYRLQRSDMLDAIQAFYDEPRDRAIGIGDLVHHGRRIKRDRLDREEDAAHQARQQSLDIKAADETRALAQAIPFGPTTNRTDRLEAAERALQCCTTKSEAQQAIREYFAAKTEARKVQA